MNELIDSITLRAPVLQDKILFLEAMTQNQSLHHPWVSAPKTSEEFEIYIQKYSADQNQNKSFLLLDLSENSAGNIAGVFNINEIVRGGFQSGYLGFYSVEGYAGKGMMSAGLKLVLKKAFEELGLHRLEANIQSDNFRSTNLVKNNGFKKEGFSPRYLKINGEWRDHERWAMTYEDWLAI